jgi:CAAX protease family protein
VSWGEIVKRDAVALTVALTLPSVMTWYEFTVLYGASGVDKLLLQVVFVIGKVTQFFFPALYVWFTDRSHLRFSIPRERDLMLGGAVGLVVGLGALGLYWILLRDTPLMAQTGQLVLRWLEEYQLATPAGYWTMALLMITLHAFIEEYYWRWFVFRWLHRYLPLGPAIVLSGIGFMIHHVVILSVYLPGYVWTGVVPFSVCTAVGGMIWAWLYNRGQSLYPVWLSHGLVDLALMGIGFDLVSCYW